MTRRRVVVTGMGVVSAAGCDLAGFWAALASGRSAVRAIERFDASGFPSRVAGEITDFRWRDLAPLSDAWAHGGLMSQYAGVAAARALADAELPAADRRRAGVAVATGMGRYAHAEVAAPCGAARALGRDVDWGAFARSLRAHLQPESAERRTPGSVTGLLAREMGLRGPAMAVMTACAGGTQAIGDALRWVRSGRCDVALAGATDSELYPMGVASFCLLGALSQRNDDPAGASRPFDAGRDGFVIGEGAGMLLLEERERARARGARIYAEVLGFGSGCDAWRATDPHPEGRGAVSAMTRALAHAGVDAADIDYVNAHGTGTVANDRVETLALKRVLGERASRVAVSSTKSMIGHLTVAAGAVEAIATVLTLVHQVLPPTINQAAPDPACDLDYVPNRSRAAEVRLALSNSFAFGGQTAALVLRCAEP